jgi:hypothetical protein
VEEWRDGCEILTPLVYFEAQFIKFAYTNFLFETLSYFTLVAQGSLLGCIIERTCLSIHPFVTSPTILRISIKFGIGGLINTVGRIYFLFVSVQYKLKITSNIINFLVNDSLRRRLLYDMKYRLQQETKNKLLNSV